MGRIIVAAVLIFGALAGVSIVAQYVYNELRSPFTPRSTKFFLVMAIAVVIIVSLAYIQGAPSAAR